MAERPLTELDFNGNLDFNQILTNPFLDIAARFWESSRYEAFRICYRSMRSLDDLVDNRKIEGRPLTDEEKDRYKQLIARWLDALRQRSARDSFMVELLAARDRFGIPVWPWERLCRAMSYDLDHDGFGSLRMFLRYSEGAAIAPASVFMHLCGVRCQAADRILPPSFDIRTAARPLALFSYLVHIIRDFQKDQLSGLNYFATDSLTWHSLGIADLRQAAAGGEIPDRLRDLIGQYRALADYYRRKARLQLDGLVPLIEPRYQLSLEVIYGLYHLVFERIDPSQGHFSEEELNPPPEEVQKRLSQIVTNFKKNNNL